jgi:hypothetical protein
MRGGRLVFPKGYNRVGIFFPSSEDGNRFNFRNIMFSSYLEYRLLVGKPEGKRPLGRPRRRWVDNIRMDLGEVGWNDVDWTGLAQDGNRWRALVNSVLNLRVP